MPADTLSVMQAVLALATCVLLVVYIVATHRLQRQAQEQSNIQQRQIDEAKEQLSQVLLRERYLFRPDLQWRDGYSGENEAKWEFENLGADICNLRWSGPKGVLMEHEPRHMIRTFDQGAVSLQAKDEPLCFPLQFSVTYNNRFGETCTQGFEIATPGIAPREASST